MDAQVALKASAELKPSTPMSKFVGATGVPAVAGQLQSVACIVAVGTAIFAVFGRHAIAGGMVAFFRLGHVCLQYSS